MSKKYHYQQKYMRYYVFAIPLPFSIEKYKLGQLYMVARSTLEESSKKSSDGFEILKNEPYTRTLPSGQEESGIYTFKILHLSKMVPKAVANLIPKKGLKMEETCYNAFPHTVTSYHNPGYPDKLAMSVETWVYSAPKNASYSEAFDLPEDVRKCIPESFTLEKKDKESMKKDKEALKERKDTEDISKLEFAEAKGGVIERVYCDVTQPLKIDKKKEAREKKLAAKENREAPKALSEGPLKADIKRISKENNGDHCVVYKILKIHTAFPGEKLIESMLGKKMESVFTETHKKCCIWWDEWKEMTMDDIKKMETDAVEKLKESIAEREAAGNDSKETESTGDDDDDEVVEDADKADEK